MSERSAMKRLDYDFPASGTAEQQAYQHLLSGIRTGRYKPGERLIPETIAGELTMSRMPVREAFRRLASEGLVLIRPNRGCLVSRLSLEEIEEAFYIRSVLEGLAVRLAVPNIAPTHIAELVHRVEMMGVDDAEEGNDWIARHQAFHDYLCSLCGRKKLLKQIRVLNVSVEPYLRVYFHHASKDRNITAVHLSLVEAISTGDPDLAERAMQSHVMGTVPLIMKFMNSQANP